MRSYFSYLKSNWPLAAFWVMALFILIYSIIDDAMIMVFFMTFCIVFSVVASVIDWKRNG